MKLDKYKQNLAVRGSDVYSYTTLVAKIDEPNQQVIELGYWSQTTSKHINYVAEKLNYSVKKFKKD
jgi:hypothetical protein